MTSKQIPSEEDLNKAHEYAMMFMCTEVPQKLTGRTGDTYWDFAKKQCRFTKQGCTPESRNPFSQPMYDSNGKAMDYSNNGGVYDKLWAKNPPSFLQMKAIKTKSGYSELGCGRGNFLLQNWCDNPKSRADKSKPGVTNVDGFRYYINTAGKETCSIPKSYCDEKGLDYSTRTKQCYKNTLQAIGEFVIGTTIIREARVSDKRLKENIQMFKENYGGPNVHLYTYTWTKKAEKLYGNKGPDIGFLANDIENLGYNCVFIDDKGYKNINFDCLSNNNMTKIINFLNAKKTVYDNLNKHI